jgi:FKBP-type peptidyl-prolyl cis-trans isomerase
MAPAAPAAKEAAANSKLVVKEISKPDMSGVVMNALKKGDYIRVDYKIYLDKLGGTLVDSTDKTGPVQFQVGMGKTFGTAGTINPKQGGLKVPLLPVFDQVILGNTVGAKYELEVPPELAYGGGATTGIGVQVPAGKTVYASFRIRSRVFAGIVGGEQGTFLEDDNIGKFNELLGTTF